MPLSKDLMDEIRLSQTEERPIDQKVVRRTNVRAALRLLLESIADNADDEEEAMEHLKYCTGKLQAAWTAIARYDVGH